MAVFEHRQPVPAAKFINKSLLFILLLGVIRLLKPKLISRQRGGIYLSSAMFGNAVLPVVLFGSSYQIYY